MPFPRRRLIRPPVLDQAQQNHQRKTQQLRDRLAHERTTLARWQTRLKRAFNTVEKCQRNIARIERQLTTLEGEP
jgi:septal ring factor EnvC (AmiA/AmiB activator)